uniref:Peptidase E n=1 Tax=Caldilinea aerophila TaxID=133453 RepID=A0A7C1JI27_9CHLR
MRQIIAMGGGGFSMEPENPALDEYVIRQCGKTTPKVCFLAQASGESLEYTLNFYRAFSQLGCRPTHLSLFAAPPADARGILLSQDVIYVGGGNTKSMLALWEAWGVPAILREAYDRGIVLAGISAGAICWFEQGVTDSIAPQPDALTCLGFLSGSFCPHYDGEAMRRPAFHRLLAEGRIQPGYAADDGAAFHFIDGALHQVVASRPAARGWRLWKDERGDVHEEEMQTALLTQVTTA